MFIHIHKHMHIRIHIHMHIHIHVVLIEKNNMLCSGVMTSSFLGATVFQTFSQINKTNEPLSVCFSIDFCRQEKKLRDSFSQRISMFLAARYNIWLSHASQRPM